MQKRYPFPFLDAYKREDRDFFFGRDEEIDQLYQLTQQSNIVLLYGHSGTGKTSLIRCGLANKFRSYDWQDVYVRRGAHLTRSLDQALSEESDGAFRPEEHGNDTITDLPWKLEAVHKASFKPLYLIFDQFEELYVLGSREEQAAFIRTIQDILQVEQPVKIILSIREEYLGHLYDFERAVPELQRKKLRVEPMNLDKVKKVIQGVGSHETSNVRLQSREEDAIAQGIFDKIRGEEKTLSIQLPYLQVFLDKLYLQITHDETRQASATFTSAALEQMGGIGDVLRDFLDEQVLLIARQLDQTPDTLWRILSLFVTLEGTKEPLPDEQLRERLPGLPASLITSALEAFVTRRILRYTERDQLYEIAHDSLARQIHARRNDEEIALLEVQRLIRSQALMRAEARALLTEKQLAFIEPYLPRLSPAEQALIAESRQAAEAERRRKQRQRRGLAAAAVAIILALSGLTGWALQQQRAAEEALAKAEQANAARIERESENQLLQARDLLRRAGGLGRFPDQQRQLMEEAARQMAGFKADSLLEIGAYQEIAPLRELRQLHDSVRAELVQNK